LTVAILGLCVLGSSASVEAKPKPPRPCQFNGSQTYPGDDASKQALAQWMAEGALKANVPVELPVMGALAASGLQNLSSGDSDSVGFSKCAWASGTTVPMLVFRNTPISISSGLSTRRSSSSSSF